MTESGRGYPIRVDALLARAAESRPDRPAVVFGGRTWTYGTVLDRARRLAGALAGLGIVSGDRVALWATNRAEFVEVFFGVPMLGAIACPLDFWWTWQDVAAALAQTRPRVLIVGAAQLAAMQAAGAGVRELGVEHVLCLDEPAPAEASASYQAALDAAVPLDRPTPVVPTDPATILFTSGSTGRSKGAVHTHGGLTAAAVTMTLELGLADDERTLHFLPLFSSCLEHLLPFTLVGATHVVMPHFDPPAVWETVRDADITHFDAVPTTLRRLLEVAPAKVSDSLRMISYASERMPDPLITALIDRMPHVRFIQFYGMIEHLCLTVLPAADQLRKIGTVGRPMLGAELALLPVADGSEGAGEIIARSPSLFAGYWQDPEATNQVMRDGWMRTGDLGAFDQDGYLRLEGRLKEMIKTGGLTVIPSEVEAALVAHPAVADAAVVGVPDERWGEAVHAFVIPAPGASVSAADLTAFCHERLAGYKRPKAIHVVTTLPRTGIGKVARRVIREQLLASDPN
ncbi:MAG: AMP-binding protein [Gemmatimonadales bacterium]|nr:AMP-binding protein [Gemmatimonadales bacterium]